MPNETCFVFLQVIFVSNDRDADNYELSCQKVAGMDAMAYDLSKTAQMHDLFGLKTIPALMIIQNKNFDADKPFVVANAREILELDPELKRFPWSSIEKRQAAPVTAAERLWIHGRHGMWWQLGHKDVSPLHPKDMYMDEVCVARLPMIKRFHICSHFLLQLFSPIACC